VCRNPKIRSELQWFPLTEALVLTGLRWGEVAAWMWSAVSESSRLITVKRAIEHYGPASPENATKTGAEWTIPLRNPLLRLVRRQRERSYVGNADGWIFPNSKGGATHYKNWYNRGWKRVLQKAKVEATEGDAQKMLRKTYITNALVCGRLPKRVAAEVGHASLRMITEQYEMFMDEKNWPDPEEIARLVSIYGWTDVSTAAAAGRLGQSRR
jgi:integrase